MLSGATCEMMDFHVEHVWEKLLNDEALTVFTAVPTIYSIEIRSINIKSDAY